MPINPLQLPSPIAEPQLDWSRLDRIGEAIANYRQQQAESEAIGSYIGGRTPPGEPAQPAPLARPSPPGGQLPRGLRNNNPGNIEDGPFAKTLPGYKGSDGRFAIFDTPDAGANAMDALLTSYGRRGIKTAGELVSRWAPASDGNNVDAYARHVGGGDPNAAIDLNDPAQRKSVAQRMAQFENGAAAPAQSGTAQAGMSESEVKRLQALLAAGGKARELGLSILQKQLEPKYGFQTLPDGTVMRTNPNSGSVEPVYQSNKPTLHEIGTDANGNKVFGLVDLATGRVKAINAQNVPGLGGSALNSDVTGEDYLKTLDPGRAAMVKAIVEGRQQPPGGLALRSPQVQAWMRDAAQYEPGFDMTKWTQRNATARDFGSGGKSAQNVTAFNTTIQHGERLYDKIDKLGNFERFPALNIPYNAARAQLDPEFRNVRTEFEDDKEAFTRELTRAFRGSGGNVIDIIGWEKRFNSADSPGALKAAVKEAMQLLAGRVEAVADNYNRGMNTRKEPLALLSPKASASMQRLMGEAPRQAGKSQPGGMKAFATPEEVEEAIREGVLKHGESFKTPDGQIRKATTGSAQ